MSVTIIEVYQKAQKDFLEKKYNEALAGFATVLSNNPDHLWSRFQVGNTLETMKKINRAFEVYEFLVSHCIKAGYPLLGLVAARRAEHIQASISDLLENMADLYSLESDRIDNNLMFPPLPDLQPDMEATTIIEADDKTAPTAEQIAKTIPDNRYPISLPALPLFSLLTLEAFFPILDISETRSFQEGEIIIQEDEPASSFFLIAYGTVEIFKGEADQSKTLAHLEPGSVFGEMSLITSDPRTAGARAHTECEVFEIKPEDIETAAEEIYDINSALDKFTRERILNHLLITSPVFAPFSQDIRSELFDCFTSVVVSSEDVIVNTGAHGSGLHLILSGEVKITHSDGRSFLLKEGSVFGESFLVHDKPSAMTITTTKGGEFLFLSRKDFQEFLNERSEIQEILNELSEESLLPRQIAGQATLEGPENHHALI